MYQIEIISTLILINFTMKTKYLSLKKMSIFVTLFFLSNVYETLFSLKAFL